MADTTTNQGFPFPEENDPPAGHTQIEALATDLDTKWPIRTKGKSIIATEQSVTSTSDTSMGTPDTISGLVLPTDGLIFVLAHFQMKNTKGSQVGTARARLLLNTDNVRKENSGSLTDANSRVMVELNTFDSGIDGVYHSVTSYGGGLHLAYGATAAPAPLTTGQLVAARNEAGFSEPPYWSGGPMAIFAAAGTYDLKLMFAGPGFSGDVKAKNRKLWAWTMGF